MIGNNYTGVNNRHLLVIHRFHSLMNQSELQRRLYVLINQHLNTTIYAVSKEMDMSRVTLNRAINEHKTVSSEIIDKLLSKHPEINVDWLFTGRGVPLFNRESPDFQEPKLGYGRGRPIYIVHASRYEEYINKLNDIEYVRSLPSTTAPMMEIGEFRDFEVAGNAMQNEENTGLFDRDILRCQLIPKELAPKAIKPGSVVVCVTKDHIHIQVLDKFTANDVHLRSLNPIYPPESIPIRKVLEIWVYRSLITTRELNYTKSTPA